MGDVEYVGKKDYGDHVNVEIKCDHDPPEMQNAPEYRGILPEQIESDEKPHVSVGGGEW